LGTGITTINEGAFSSTAIEEIYIPANVIYVDDNAFEGCENLKSVKIGSTDTPISAAQTKFGRYVFNNCDQLKSLSIGNNVLAIGYHNFGDCTLITDLVIPNSVKSIEIYAFSGIDNLKNITIGSSVSSIGDYAFLGCFQIEKILCLASNPPEITDNCWNDVNYSSTSLTVPEKSLELYKKHSFWGKFVHIQAQK
jgi:hypothetical protein